ncbi:hypothetical protein BTM25_18740 [Actinomadura rubteroloni]|uniref:Uncharacterized protein n=1 Tax=Actinomadura rubteroloni TaxID=1926885 RepID=A0A2P4UQX8_9ACTN|nr:hypothetical protein [Actinomadura rubteroloni]POM27459.1 hypothetical protein BTM25_18740 [Actinomadura rubteroloni]
MPEEGPGADRGPLLRFLRDLARARRGPARDLAAYERVHWLAELPGDVYVETDAGPGDVLFSVPMIPLSPPAVIEEFDGWLALRHWYRTLRDLAAVRGEEVVLATGLFTRGAVRDHLLATPVRIVVDERSERVDVVLSGGTGLRDRELLDGVEGFTPDRTAWVRDAVENGRGFGLNASVSDVLRKWSGVAFIDEDIAFREDWAPEHPASVPAARLRLAPALVVRPPGRAAVAAYYDEIIAQPWLPAGFGALLAADAPSPLLSAEETDTPRLVAELLGRGSRVLAVTADAASAARLHAALAPGIAELCALPTTSGLVAEAIRGRAAGADPAAQRRRVDELAARTAEAEQEAAELRERLDRVEAGDEPAAVPSWIPPRPGLPETPPIGAPEAAELVRLLADRGPDRTGHRDVDPGTLPSAPYVRTLIEAEAAAAERAGAADTEVSAALRRCDTSVLAQLDARAMVVNAALRDLGLTGHPAGWKHTDPTVRAFTDLLARRRPGVWSRVEELTDRAEEAAAALETIAGRLIELPPGDPPLRLLAADARELRGQIAAGVAPRRGVLRVPVHRPTELLAGCFVDGESVVTVDRLDALHTHVMVLLTCRELQAAWEDAGVSFPADVPLPERVARFRRAHLRLERVRSVKPAVEESVELIAAAGLPVQITHPLQWYGYSAGLEHVLLGQGIERAAGDLAALRDSIPVSRSDPPELTAARAAIDARDAAAYGHALAGLAEARHRRAAQLRRDELLERVEFVHSELADLLRDGEDWTDRVATWDEAWRAAALPGPAPVAPSPETLRADAAEAADRHRALAAELTAARAWQAWSDRPGVVPAWIVPLWQVPDVLPPGPDSFDVVLVDGEHGAGAEALFLLWLAPRVVLLGAAGPPLPPPERSPAPDALPPALRDLVTPTTTLYTLLRDRFAKVRSLADEPGPEPERADESEAHGRSIVTYKRPELLALVAQLAAEDRAADDDALVERARGELSCPPSEDGLVEARLRFAVETYRASVD